MGRDGIFAYFGRLGQLAARGDNEPAVAAYPADESRMARPTVRYVVYSREVAFGSDANLKYRYLLQFVNPGEEIHCFDTGYRGSVPKDVLKIMGTPLTQIGDHIHLLQCNSFMGKVKRQIKGLPKNLSINTIEGYDQDEQSATGLVETEGAIKYRARLSEPSEQFKFLARRHMLYSYFLNSERHKISSGQVRRGIRIP